MILRNQSHHKNTLLAVIVLLLLAGVSYLVWQRMLPAGELLGGNIDAWKTFRDDSLGASFRYPAGLSTAYIHTVDWPPKLSLMPGPSSCTEAGQETARAGQTKIQMINGRTYCVTRESEGAAGSIYTQYAFAWPAGDKVAILTFSLRAVQCGNYDDPQKTQCEKERAVFDIDPLIARMAETVQFFKPGAG